jgi:pimeloyl-ACP methyl ester carboxylesterase
MQYRARLGIVSVALAGLLGAATAAAGPGEQDDLKRRGFFGAQLGAMNEQVKAEQKLSSDDGAEIRDVIAGSAAEVAGIQPGDVLLAIDGAKVKTPADAVTRIGRAKEGDVLALDLVRDAEKLTKKVTLKGRPKESSENFETIYGTLTSKAGRLRTIVTRPKSPGKYPALLLIPGLGCYSVEGLAARPTEFQLIAGEFAAGGYVTLRVEKPGCGDSEGGPCEDVDFETELDGYRQGLVMLKSLESVDPSKVLLFGHSLGGLWAPIVASENAVKGVAVYGTVLKPWYEYELENRRRQLLLEGAPYAEIDREMRAFAAFLSHVYTDKVPPKKVVEEHPELKEMQSTFSPDGVHMYGRSIRFMQQVAALPISEYWSKVDAHVLALWGKAEYVSTEADHRMLADLINRRHAGHGKFLALDGMDHGFHRAVSAEQRYKEVRSGSSAAEFHPLIVETLLEWADALVKTP